MLVPTFEDREVSRGQRGGFPYGPILGSLDRTQEPTQIIKAKSNLTSYLFSNIIIYTCLRSHRHETTLQLPTFQRHSRTPKQTLLMEPDMAPENSVLFKQWTL
jgi:hypothetical protein